MKKCPNNDTEEATEIIGHYDADGIIVYESTKKEENIRRSAICETKNCTNWNGSECILPSVIMTEFATIDVLSRSKSCSIRKDCRWFHQEGIKICKICPVI